MNIRGDDALIDFFSRWSPKELGYRVGRPIIKRLADHSKFEAIENLAIKGSRNAYLILGIAHELAKLCRFIPKECIDTALIILTHHKIRPETVKKRQYGEPDYLSAYVAIAEAAIYYKLDLKKIKRLLKIHVPQQASPSFSSDHGLEDRVSFLKPHVLLNYLDGKYELESQMLMPKLWLDKKESYDNKREKEEFCQIVEALSPWLFLRLKIIRGQGSIDNIDSCIEAASSASNKATASRYKEYDPLRYEIQCVRFECLVISKTISVNEIEKFKSWLKPNDNTIRFLERMKFCHIAYRNESLEELRSLLEDSCYQVVDSINDEPPESIADYYIDLARAVLPVQKENAKAYFDTAVEVVSKFGDEGLDRWQAINALGKQASCNRRLTDSLAYRFIRCGEVVSGFESKYFDWREAIKTLTYQSPCSVFSILSRLRDRNVGCFEELLAIAINHLLAQKHLSPEVAWAFTSFLGFSDSEKIACQCLEYNKIETIFRKFIKEAQLAKAGKATWLKIKEITQRHMFQFEELNSIVAFYEGYGGVDEEVNSTYSYSSLQLNDEKYNYDDLVADIDFSHTDSVNIACKRFDAIDGTRSPEIFWQTVIHKIPIGSEYVFVNSAAHSSTIDLYDLKNIFQNVPPEWWNKITLKKNKEKIFRSICKQQSLRLLSNSYSYKHHFDYFLSQYDVSEQLIAESILEGLVGGQDILHPQLLFSLVKLLARMLSPEEAERVLEYALERLELFIDEEQAGGIWNNELSPPNDISEAATGLIWAALASPHAKVRWNAAHCVRQLGELGCTQELAQLIAWSKKDVPKAFVDKKLPFYELHARQYLLIALARIALDDPISLLSHGKFFEKIALDGIPHVLIQHFAVKTVLLIEKSMPGTYDDSVVKKLQTVNVSPFTKLKLEEYGKNSQVVPWLGEKEVQDDEDLHFGWDFDRYWYEPLGRIFGLSTQKIQMVARKVIRNEWKLSVTGKYIDDPRSGQWKGYYGERPTYHRHGSYPKTDTLSFYFSYHAMFWVAGKLLTSMPIVENSYSWEEDEWGYWFNHHTLTLHDSRWLADTRDPEPLHYRPWFNDDESNKDWRWQVMPNDFYDVLVSSHNDDFFINVNGYWSYARGRKKESVTLSSALVSPRTSMALLRVLQTYENHHDYKIPDAGEHVEINHKQFILQGWIQDFSSDKHFDEYDPHAEAIPYPVCFPAEFIQQEFSLYLDKTKRQWLNENEQVCLISEVWSNGEQQDHGDCKARGKRLKATLEFLADMLQRLDKQLIIEVRIERSYCNSYSNREEDDDLKYPRPYTQLLLLDSSGKLSTLYSYYELGKTSN